MDRRGQVILLAGLYDLLHEYIVRPLAEAGERIELPPSTFVVHFGGWKKLQRQAVSKALLNELAAAVFGLPSSAIVDIYGFTEQLGVIYPDDAAGVKRVPTYAEVLVRDPRSPGGRARWRSRPAGILAPCRTVIRASPCCWTTRGESCLASRARDLKSSAGRRRRNRGDVETRCRGENTT